MNNNHTKKILIVFSLIMLVVPHGFTLPNRQGIQGIKPDPIRSQKQDVFRLLADFPANVYSSEYSTNPNVAVLTNGDFVIIWISTHNDLQGDSIFAQRFTNDNTPTGPEFQVNVNATGSFYSSIAGLNDGGYVISWANNNHQIVAQRYDSDNVPFGSVEFPVSIYDSNQNPWFNSIAVLNDGSYVIAWGADPRSQEGQHVYAQRFYSNNTLYGEQFQVDSLEDAQYPIICSLSNGGFAITYSGVSPSPRVYGSYVSKYNSDSTRDGAEFKASTGKKSPSIAGLSNGGFVISSRDYGKVFVDKFNSNGNNVGSTVYANTNDTSGPYDTTRVANLIDGSYLIVWISNNEGGSGGDVYAQRYKADDTDHTKYGGEFRINSNITDDQFDNQVASTSDGFIVVYTSTKVTASRFYICTSNSDCTQKDASTCDTDRGICISCSSSSDCSHQTDTPTCLDGKCSCTSSTTCVSIGLLMCASGSCANCSSNTDCSDPNKPNCFKGSCVQCGNSVDCTNLNSSRCASNSTCTSCRMNIDCTHIPGKPKCSSNACNNCTSHTDCSYISGKPYCFEGACKECARADCSYYHNYASRFTYAGPLLLVMFVLALLNIF